MPRYLRNWMISCTMGNVERGNAYGGAWQRPKISRAGAAAQRRYGDTPADAAGWLQNVAGLAHIFVLEKTQGQPEAMLAAVPVEYAHRKGIWFCGAAAAEGVDSASFLPRLLSGCLRAFGAKEYDFAVWHRKMPGGQRPVKPWALRIFCPCGCCKSYPTQPLAQAEFDSLTVRHLLEMRLRRVRCRFA